MSSKSSAKSSRGSETIFFFKWATTLLEAYTKTIKNNFLKTLVAHCTRARMGDEEASKSFDFSELGANPRIVKDDREDIRKRLKEAKNRVWTDEEAKPETPISLTELSTLYRLKTLVKMCEQLSSVMEKMYKWLDNNNKAFYKVAGMSTILDSVVKMFESVCGMGEVFRLTSVNWMTCKHAKVLNPTENEYVRADDERLEITKHPEVYCQQFMSQINYYRTLVNTLACSFEGVLDTIFCSISQERCEVRHREIATIRTKLPPQYLYSKDSLKFSRRTARLLKNPPPNEFTFPMNLDCSDESKKSEKKPMESKKSTKKVTSSKYHHGRTNEGKSGKSEKKSEKSMKSEQTQPSDKSKSKSKSKKSKKSLLNKVLGKRNDSKKSDRE